MRTCTLGCYGFDIYIIAERLSTRFCDPPGGLLVAGWIYNEDPHFVGKPTTLLKCTTHDTDLHLRAHQKICYGKTIVLDQHVVELILWRIHPNYVFPA